MVVACIIYFKPTDSDPRDLFCFLIHIQKYKNSSFKNNKQN